MGIGSCGQRGDEDSQPEKPTANLRHGGIIVAELRQHFSCSHETLLPHTEVFNADPVRTDSADFSNAAASLAVATLNETVWRDGESLFAAWGASWAARIRVVRKTDADRCAAAPAVKYGLLF